MINPHKAAWDGMANIERFMREMRPYAKPIKRLVDGGTTTEEAGVAGGGGPGPSGGSEGSLGSNMDPYSLASEGYSAPSGGQSLGRTTGSPTPQTGGLSSTQYDLNNITWSQVRDFIAQNGINIATNVLGGPVVAAVNGISGLTGNGTVGSYFASQLGGSGYATPDNGVLAGSDKSGTVNDSLHGGTPGTNYQGSVDTQDGTGPANTAQQGTDQYGNYQVNADGSKHYLDSEGDTWHFTTDGKKVYDDNLNAQQGSGDGTQLAGVTVGAPSPGVAGTPSPSPAPGTGNTLDPVTITGSGGPTALSPVTITGSRVSDGGPLMPPAPSPSPVPAPPAPSPAPYVALTPAPGPTPSPPAPGPSPTPAPVVDSGTGHHLRIYDPAIVPGMSWQQMAGGTLGGLAPVQTPAVPGGNYTDPGYGGGNGGGGGALGSMQPPTPAPGPPAAPTRPLTAGPLLGTGPSHAPVPAPATGALSAVGPVTAGSIAAAGGPATGGANTQAQINALLAQDPTGRNPAVAQQLQNLGVNLSSLSSPQDVYAQRYISGQTPLPAGWSTKTVNGTVQPIAPDGSQRWPEQMTAPSGSGLTQNQWDASNAGGQYSLTNPSYQSGTTSDPALKTNFMNYLNSNGGNLTPSLINQFSSTYRTTPQALGNALGYTPQQVDQFMLG